MSLRNLLQCIRIQYFTKIHTAVIEIELNEIKVQKKN